MSNTHTSINNYLSKVKKGSILFPTDFRGLGTEGAIKMALSRLVKEGKLKRVAHGIYYVPKTDPLLGELHPGAEKIAEAIAQKEKILIKPSGASALNKLGLSTQVPMRLVYITNGSPRKLKIGKMTVVFKATTSKKLAMEGRISGLVLQALEELDLENVQPQTVAKIKSLLMKENPSKLKHDLALAPARLNDYIVKLLNEKDYDRMVEANR
ncbi:Transcriptional regulator, AbiEi antitoxin, Type IV TA system [Lacibacter cauensis]|uniref:Transcriptional regulator, AbiEi antitoxin, Type IV TA system n=1 Tax=Lacibacter cauensis TaxID=510947 RepID=A0A562S9H1_9BACT|nr:AbiEi antitoxin N-terminal domain-containing protein [Lacibacter cauensis]TWI77958.1 Transcriptional regulator, AbiEi antitoxin, Type IV TA system [Lacibacter cauensis]